MSGKWISLLLLSLTAAAPASGGNQSRPLNMETLSVVDGLSSNYVYAITQDRAGYMWFGTENGLDRYDGKTIRHYQHFPDNPQSLSDSRVNCLRPPTGACWSGPKRESTSTCLKRTFLRPTPRRGRSTSRTSAR